MKTIQFTLAALLCALVIAVKPVMAEESKPPITTYEAANDDPMDDNQWTRYGYYSPQLPALKQLDFPYGDTVFQIRGYCYSIKGSHVPEVKIWMNKDLPLKSRKNYTYDIESVDIYAKVEGKEKKAFGATYKRGWLTFDYEREVMKYLKGSTDVFFRFSMYDGEVITLWFPIDNLIEAHEGAEASCRAAM